MKKFALLIASAAILATGCGRTKSYVTAEPGTGGGVDNHNLLNHPSGEGLAVDTSTDKFDKGFAPKIPVEKKEVVEAAPMPSHDANDSTASASAAPAHEAPKAEETKKDEPKKESKAEAKHSEPKAKH